METCTEEEDEVEGAEDDERFARHSRECLFVVEPSKECAASFLCCDRCLFEFGNGWRDFVLQRTSIETCSITMSQHVEVK